MKTKIIKFGIATLLLASSTAALASDRSTYSAYTRGTTTTIPVSRVAQLCGDIDGCKIRLAMYV